MHKVSDYITSQRLAGAGIFIYIILSTLYHEKLQTAFLGSDYYLSSVKRRVVMDFVFNAIGTSAGLQIPTAK